MKYVERTDDIEKVYSVHYDGEKLKKLLDEIVRKASYRVDGSFTASSSNVVKTDGNIFISDEDLPNGDHVYENIEDVYYFPSESSYGYHSDSIGFNGTKVISPELAYIIKKILSNKSKGIYELINYRNHDDLIPIDKKIENAEMNVNRISNFDFENKINALKILKKHCEDKEENRYFDVALLNHYYSQAISLFELHLISEKTLKNNESVLLKDYIPSK